jgi:uncharacterized membrane protein YeaQ/YmgE (transglycosylase-associated protein family)
MWSFRTMGRSISAIIGAIAGWLAGQIMKGKGYGLLMNVIIGLIGAFVGNVVFGILGLEPTNFIGRILCASLVLSY